MDKIDNINKLVGNWIKIADKDLLTAKQGLEAKEVVTETVCFHCQQAAEKYLKAFLVKYQIEFNKTHSLMFLINLCATKDAKIKDNFGDADMLTDYAVEIRYPDDWYEPTVEEAEVAYRMAEKIKNYIVPKLTN